MQLSIIIPIYNSEKYLQECLNSIKNISNIDFECLMIDDGSLDASKVICERFINDRFKYFYKNNSGVSCTRNYGIKQAKGKYLLFLDADDYLNRNIEKSLIKAMKDEIDFTIFDYEIKINKKRVHKKITQDKDDILEDTIYKIYSTAELNTCWGKLFKKKIIEKNGLKFYEDIKIGEDQIFVMEYINLIKSVQYIHEEILTYRINKMSAMNTYNPDERWNDLKRCYMIAKKTQIIQKYTDLFMLMSYSYMNEITYHFRQLSNILSIGNYLKVYNLRLKDDLLSEIVGNIDCIKKMGMLKRMELFYLINKVKFGGLYFFIKGKILKLN